MSNGRAQGRTVSERVCLIEANQVSFGSIKTGIETRASIMVINLPSMKLEETEVITDVGLATGDMFIMLDEARCCWPVLFSPASPLGSRAME